MREILFRGKSVNDGEWVEGSLVITTIEPADEPPVKHYHIEDMTIGVFPNEYQSGITETVAPSTVGQFTGLTDKNGKKIFEGDIVRYVNPEEDVINGRVVYGEHSYSGTHEVGFYVEWQRPEWAMYIRDDLGFWTNFREIEVIGNIHDNPELLGGDAEWLT